MAMRLIGITGGVGAGKSEILDWISGHYNCIVLKADEIANQIKKPGEKCYESLCTLLGQEILQEDKTIDKQRMAEKIFADPALLKQVNDILHPAVKEYILQEIDRRRREGLIDYFFLEAALLIEDGYTEILDELWYVRADEQVRRARLKASRDYSDEKINRILKAQLAEEDFLKHCSVVIDNSGTKEEAYKQIIKKLGDIRWQSR